MTTYRIEHDLLGNRDIPANLYYGIHTLRACENFPISGVPISAFPSLINALACVKQAAARTNLELGLLGKETAQAIERACEKIRAGQFHEHFVVDVMQGGAGTSTNMNANEVVANIALEELGCVRGDYAHLHPNEDVNLGQSTNDVYPTALKLAVHADIDALLAAMQRLRLSFERKAVEFADDLKIGRTQLQDAVPMTVGQEFGAFAAMLADDELRLKEAARLLCEINLGATAIGTGINTPPEYAPLVCSHLAAIVGLPLSTAPNLIAATQDVGAFVQVSSALKRIAVRLSKTCNDLRLLASGPRAGFGEINLPSVQAGSSIMPGKVNPVIPEVMNQVAFEVIGNDVTVSLAAEAGQLQLNAFEPVIGFSLFKSLAHLRAACDVLATRCVDGITINRERIDALFDTSISLVTALNPYIGYTNASEIAKEALLSGRRISDIVLEKGLLNDRQLALVLQPSTLTGPRALLTLT